MSLPGWLGLSDEPAHLAGYGPIPAPLARRLTATTGDLSLARLVADPLTGELLDATPYRYRPGDALRRYVGLRDATCFNPVCSAPFERCETDHTVPFDHEHPTRGGRTVRANTGPGCTPDHTVKHLPGWHVTRDADGTVHWRTPSGHTYRKPPHDYLRLHLDGLVGPPRHLDWAGELGALDPVPAGVPADVTVLDDDAPPF